jgi:antitoxin HicB
MKRKESVSAAAHTYTVLLQPEPEGGYAVTCPSLPGLVTYGETLQEARAMAAVAIQGDIECLRGWRAGPGKRSGAGAPD